MNGFLGLIIADLGRMNSQTILGFLRQYFIPRGGTFPYIFWLRVVHCARRSWLTKWTIGLIAYPILRHFEFKYGIHANPNIDIGGGLFIVHGDGVHLNCASIGRNLTIYHGATLGILRGQRPIIGDNVTIYPHSVIVGGVRLGDGSTVGALSYVSHDVPVGATVVGAPAHIVKE